MYETEKKIFEDAFNRIIPGIQMFVRDVNLPPHIAAKYQPEMILQERTFCGASGRMGGMIMSHRFTILSNHIFNASQHIDDHGWGLHICQRDSFFKVIDIYEYAGRTQIALLHLRDEDWHLFQNVDCNILGLIDRCRDIFEKHCLLDAIPELTTMDWLIRCEKPVGMDSETFEFYPFEQREPLKPQ